MSDLIINNIKIGTDGEGRFSLNDLHKAAGGYERQKPALFYRSDSFKNVEEILTRQNRTFKPKVTKRGRYHGGTWVCKELVYKYAMWVNAEFEVRVIQTFDSMIKAHNNPQTMEALNDLAAKIESDVDLASKCGKLLNSYRKIKADNEQEWKASVDKVQVSFGF